MDGCSNAMLLRRALPWSRSSAGWVERPGRVFPIWRGTHRRAAV